MAAKVLRGSRKVFVDKVTLPVLKQLLDDLLDEKILNEEEKDSVLEMNLSRADKARCLFDIVLRKGDRGSQEMMSSIQKLDPELFSQLGLAPPAAPLLQPPAPGSNLNESGKTKDASVYPVNAAAPRLGLIITNKTFQCGTLNRRGAEKDEENMEGLLRHLRCEVVKHSDVTAKEMDKALREFSKDARLQQADSVFVVIMSHGRMGAVFGVGWTEEQPDEFCTDNIFKYLNTENCPALLNKPKIVIIQACRGEKDGAAMVSDGTCPDSSLSPDSACGPGSECAGEEEQLEEDVLSFRHKEKDFISFLSCTPETVSYRDPARGSLLIQYMVEVFNDFSRQDDIEELFRKVMRRFEDFPHPSKRQMATKDRCTLTRRFFLFPGN